MKNDEKNARVLSVLNKFMAGDKSLEEAIAEAQGLSAEEMQTLVSMMADERKPETRVVRTRRVNSVA